MAAHKQDICSSMHAPAAPQLPEQVVCHMLRHVDLQQRLNCCSLVSKAWRAAAGAATADVTMRAYPKNTAISHGSRVDSLERWLLAHGPAVTQLRVEGCYAGGQQVQLPYATLQRLQRLWIHRYELLPADSSLRTQEHKQQLAPLASAVTTTSSSSSSSNSAGHSLACWSSLTALDFDHVTGSLAGLPALTKLQRLQLEKHKVPKRPTQPLQQQQQQQQQEQQQKEAEHALQQTVHNALAALTQLTWLKLTPDVLLAGAVGPFSCLQQLQELDIGFHGLRQPETLVGLPRSLTKLRMIWDGQAQLQLDGASAPALTQLTAIQHFHLLIFAPSTVRPDFVRHMQQLQVLKLEGHLSSDALSVLVAAVPLLSSLRSLSISAEGDVGNALLPASDVTQYAALLPASQHLTELELAWDEDNAALLAADCAQHMFAAGKRCGRLVNLVLGISDDRDVGLVTSEEHGSAAEQISNMPAAFGAGDVGRLAECCPALTCLYFPGLVARGVDVTPLLALPQLYCLFVGGEVIDDDVASSVLAQMTQLRWLKVYASPLTDKGLLALTVLRDLTMFEAWGCGFSSSVSSENEAGGLRLSYDSDGVPDVWLQLLARCVRSNTCVEQATAQLLAYHNDVEGQLLASISAWRLAAAESESEDF